MFVDPIGVAAQGVAEATGTATTAGVLAGAAPAMATVMPMGSEEVSAALAAAIQAHTAQFLVATGMNVADRSMFAGDIATSVAMDTATEIANTASLLI